MQPLDLVSTPPTSKASIYGISYFFPRISHFANAKAIFLVMLSKTEADCEPPTHPPCHQWLFLSPLTPVNLHFTELSTLEEFLSKSTSSSCPSQHYPHNVEMDFQTSKQTQYSFHEELLRPSIN